MSVLCLGKSSHAAWQLARNKKELATLQARHARKQVTTFKNLTLVANAEHNPQPARCSPTDLVRLEGVNSQLRQQTIHRMERTLNNTRPTNPS
jgi:hypothetical protein